MCPCLDMDHLIAISLLGHLSDSVDSHEGEHSEGEGDVDHFHEVWVPFADRHQGLSKVKSDNEEECSVADQVPESHADQVYKP